MHLVDFNHSFNKASYTRKKKKKSPVIFSKKGISSGIQMQLTYFTIHVRREAVLFRDRSAVANHVPILVVYPASCMLLRHHWSSNSFSFLLLHMLYKP